MLKIGELNEHCGKCPLIDFCTEPYETPQLCTMESLEHVDTDQYKKIADDITSHEILEKLKQYEENNCSPWSDEYHGAICDIVLEKLHQKSEVADSE